MAKIGKYIRDGVTRVAIDKPDADRMSWDGWLYVGDADVEVKAPVEAKPDVKASHPKS